jgi:hypothetical protein
MELPLGAEVPVVRSVLAVVAGIVAALVLSFVATAMVVRVYSPIVAFVPVDRVAVIGAAPVSLGSRCCR